MSRRAGKIEETGPSASADRSGLGFREPPRGLSLRIVPLGFRVLEV